MAHYSVIRVEKNKLNIELENMEMKTVILCGGLGTRLREETEFRPKPMITIGERPILWHIMKIYAHYGFTDFDTSALDALIPDWQARGAPLNTPVTSDTFGLLTKKRLWKLPTPP